MNKEVQGIKIHARVTMEIEITKEQAERLKAYSNGNPDVDISDIRALFAGNSGEYDDKGYIPSSWISEDLNTTINDDINL